MSQKNIPILYEDNDIVVVNKPAGLVVHADGRTTEPTLVDWILEKYPDMKEVGEPITTATGEIIYRPGIVHRLDRDTSGVLLIAKNKDSFEFYKAKFQDREMVKTYNAFVYGVVKRDDDIIDRPIGRSRKDFRLWSAQRLAKGEMRDAVTHYKVLERTESLTVDKGFSFLELMPKTGRTHQIRVHMKAINHPVICDKLYAPKRHKALGFERLALHARVLEFTNPNREPIRVEAPFPEDFERALVEIKKL